MMPIRYVRKSRIVNPTGDGKFFVKQCMPAAVPQEESDPFLMCDEFGPFLQEKDPFGVDSDEGFDVAWHPHHGMEILSYLTEGRGRHADSMGNRETFDGPGFQWCSVGSGIEHAEGGAQPKGEIQHGFQIWLRMPIKHMEDDPRYGIVGPEEMKTVTFDGGFVRVIAGPFGDVVGPANYTLHVQMLEVNVDPNAHWTYSVPDGMDNCMFYVFKGSATLNESTPIKEAHICRFDTSGSRTVFVQANKDGLRMMVFAGKMTKESICWHGPFVCSSRQNLQQVFRRYQTGDFPPKRVSWDYRDITKKPK